MSEQKIADLAIGLVLLLVISMPGLTVYMGWAEQEAMKEAWAIKGAPCPLAADPAADGAKADKSFDYGGVRFARRYGHVSCVAPREDGFMSETTYRVCQFSAPATVTVTQGGETTVFRPGAGHPATVTIRDGRASCVIGGWFTG